MPTAVPRPPEPSSASKPWSPPWSNWGAQRVIVVGTLGAALLTLCFFAPRFWLWRAAGLPLSEFIAIQPEFHRAFHALHQLQDPWQRIEDPVNRVIEWRLLWPVFAHTLGFSPRLYLALPHLGCLAALCATAVIGWRVTRAALPTLATTLFAATCSWFFVSTGWLAYFDSWLLLALMLASFARSRWVMFTAALLAPWIDERFILALPLCVAVRSLGAGRDSSPDRRTLLRDAVFLIAGILPYVAIRLGAEFTTARATSRSYWSDRSLLPSTPFALVWGAWNGLRLGWVLLAVSSVAAFRSGRHRVAAIVIAAVLVLSLIVADDLSRSASVLVPVLVAACLIGWQRQPVRMTRILPALCLGNLILPAQHVILAPPGATVTYHTVAILALDAELERRANPPEFANSPTYVRRSMDHFQNGNAPRALAAAEIALRFDPGSARALANHGILLYVTGRQAEGARELDRALAMAPELYESRMQRAAFRQQAGDARGALDDVRHALKYMPADWPRRADAQQFERSLASQIGR